MNTDATEAQEVSTSKEDQTGWIGGFWRRLGALIVDTLILSAIGFLLGLVLSDAFSQMDSWGRMVGFSIALAYFGLMNSQVFAGQTIGKKLFKLRVVNADNKTISLSKSLLRYVCLGAPLFLNGAVISNETLLSIWAFPLSLIIFGGIFSTGYLIICNGRTRQSLHDLIIGTYVVNSEADIQSVKPVWKFHYAVVAVILALSLSLPILAKKLVQSTMFKDLLKAQSALVEIPEVKHASVYSNVTHTASNGQSQTTYYVTAQALLQSNQITNTELADNIARRVIQNYPDATSKNYLEVTLTYGYDIGIWSSWENHTETYYRHDFDKLTR